MFEYPYMFIFKLEVKIRLSSRYDYPWNESTLRIYPPRRHYHQITYVLRIFSFTRGKFPISSHTLC